MIVKKLEVGLLGTNCYIVYSAEGAQKAVVIDPGDESFKITEIIAKFLWFCYNKL